VGDPSVPGSVIGSHRIAPNGLPSVLAGGSTHLPRVCPLLPCVLLVSLVNLGYYGLGLVVQWRLRIPTGCLSCRHLRSGMASESLNEVRFILTRRHRVPEPGKIYWSRTVSSAVKPQPHPPQWNHTLHLVAM
jgi:hypothetical protein